MKTTIKDIAEETIQVKVHGNTKKKTTIWWTEEVRQAVGLKMRCFRKWMKTRQIEDRQLYVDARNAAEQIKREAKREAWERVGEQLEEDFGGVKKLLYSMAKNYRKGENSMTGALKSADGEEFLTEPEHICQRWMQYFEGLLNVEDFIRENDENLVHEEVVNNVNYGEMDEITREEVINAIKKMKNGKATDEDGIPSEIFKALDDVGVTWLRRIFNISVLEQRLRGLVDEKIGKWQHGFRPGKGTVDLIFAMKLLMEKDWEWNKDKYAVFIDMEKAFDRVPRKKLWEALGHEEYEIPGKLKRAIKSILHETMSKVRGRDMESEWFEVRTGFLCRKNLNT
ncbi:uncharacterized protein LOC143024096 [Oratosquilla oratoria]|uniref:uncharacterized protein LOC143024096 n=1 Tax=Oratosquilla oratoria TaxID=337810 RepID=UPI003F773023